MLKQSQITIDIIASQKNEWGSFETQLWATIGNLPIALYIHIYKYIYIYTIYI